MRKEAWGIYSLRKKQDNMTQHNLYQESGNETGKYKEKSKLTQWKDGVKRKMYGEWKGLYKAGHFKP